MSAVATYTLELTPELAPAELRDTVISGQSHPKLSLSEADQVTHRPHKYLDK